MSFVSWKITAGHPNLSIQYVVDTQIFFSDHELKIFSAPRDFETLLLEASAEGSILDVSSIPFIKPLVVSGLVRHGTTRQY